MVWIKYLVFLLFVIEAQSQGPAPAGCCNEWSSWALSTPCSDNCGGCNIVNYTRTCLTASTCPCPGNSTKMGPCNTRPCGFPRNSCCGNMKATAVQKSIICIAPGDTLEPPPQTCNCCPPQGIWGSWLDASCTDTCGGYGNGTRVRTCLSDPIGCPCTGSSTMTGACNLVPCNIPREPCASGRSIQNFGESILCLTSTDMAPVSQTTCCPSEGIWEPWSEWSNCSSSCGACSTAGRTRVCASTKYGCPCSSSETYQTLPCNRLSCPSSPQCCSGSPTVLSNGNSICQTPSSSSGQWGAWTNAGCSDTCGLCGFVKQTRTCLSGTCTGSSAQNTTTTCGTGLCPVGNGKPSCCSPAKATVSGNTIICG